MRYYFRDHFLHILVRFRYRVRSPDNYLVCKFGKTCDLGRRTREHVKTYDMEGGRMQLIYKGLIDAQFRSETETKISHQMTKMDVRFKYLKHTELIIVSPQELRRVKKYFDAVTTKFQGRVKVMTDALVKKKTKIAMIRKEAENELLKKDLIISEKDKELLTKDNIILCMQLAEAKRGRS